VQVGPNLERNLKKGVFRFGSKRMWRLERQNTARNAATCKFVVAHGVGRSKQHGTEHDFSTHTSFFSCLDQGYTIQACVSLA
jgi:hypothetical protein